MFTIKSTLTSAVDIVKSVYYYSDVLIMKPKHELITLWLYSTLSEAGQITTCTLCDPNLYCNSYKMSDSVEMGSECEAAGPNDMK